MSLTNSRIRDVPDPKDRSNHTDGPGTRARASILSPPLGRRSSNGPRATCWWPIRQTSWSAPIDCILVPNLTHGGRPYIVGGNVVVDREWRRRGVATRLIKAAIELAHDFGCYKLRLVSHRERHDAHALYEHMAFQPSARGYRLYLAWVPAVSIRPATSSAHMTPRGFACRGSAVGSVCAVWADVVWITVRPWIGVITTRNAHRNTTSNTLATMRGSPRPAMR